MKVESKRISHVKLWLKPEATKSRRWTQVQDPEPRRSRNFWDQTSVNCLLQKVKIRLPG